MRGSVVLQIGALILVLLITWAITNDSFDVHKTARDFIGRVENVKTTPAPKMKCDLEQDCPEGTFALRIKSGAANVVGPKICFDGQIVMSAINNNVGAGINIVVVNGETGIVDKHGFLNTIGGHSDAILSYLKEIEPGRIVLLASFNDLTPKMTDEIRDVLESMGSTLIKSLKSKDNWVFAGRTGAAEKSPFEKISVNDPKTNKYEKWPEVVEISGCIPKTSS
ncbi:unnamed protein product [Knipowitschia caucasica]|uniref:ILEI/PANDER domain-containing protein n=1 Tax=Knipowitschia caucasica TaxID=637954 RepID=A0AAV2M7S3_KNICA